MSYSMLPGHVNLARLLLQVAELYPNAETLIGQKVLGVSSLDLNLARELRIVEDVVGAMERLELAITLASDRNGVRTAAPGILRHVPPGHLFRGIFSALDYRLEDWRDMDGASILVETDHNRTGAIRDSVRASLASAGEGRKRGAPSKQELAREAYRRLFPDGHKHLTWPQAAARVSDEMSRIAGKKQSIKEDTLKKAIGSKRKNQ